MNSEDINTVQDWEGQLEDLLELNTANDYEPVEACSEELLIHAIAVFASELSERRDSEKVWVVERSKKLIPPR